MTSMSSILYRGVHQLQAIAYKPVHWYRQRQDEKIAKIFIKQLYAFEMLDVRTANPIEVIDAASAFLDQRKVTSVSTRNELRRHLIAEKARLGIEVKAAPAEIESAHFCNGQGL